MGRLLTTLSHGNSEASSYATKVPAPTPSITFIPHYGYSADWSQTPAPKREIAEAEMCGENRPAIAEGQVLRREKAALEALALYRGRRRRGFATEQRREVVSIIGAMERQGVAPPLVRSHRRSLASAILVQKP